MIRLATRADAEAILAIYRPIVRDTVWLQCALGELPANAPPPLRLPELSNETVESALRAP